MSWAVALSAEEARRRVMAAAATLPDADRAIDLAHTISYAAASSTTFSDLRSVPGTPPRSKSGTCYFSGVLHDPGYQAEPFVSVVEARVPERMFNAPD